MHLFRLFSWHLATAGMLVGALSFFSHGPSNEDDLLDPSLDQPLPQYQSTSAAGFQESETGQPTPKAQPRVVLDEPGQPRIEVNSTGGSGTGEQLAPNPLHSLLSQGESSVAQTSPSDVRVEPPAPPVKAVKPRSIPSNPAPTAASAGEKFEAIQLTPPRPKLNPVEPRRPVDSPPQYNSPPPGNRPGFVLEPQTQPTQAVKNNKAAGAKTPKLKAKKKKGALVHQEPELNYEIYRDQTAFPIDPRKPNNPCTQTVNCGCGCCAAGKPGLYGKPYQLREPGGYACGKRCANKHPQYSAYWPRPLSAKLDERDPERAAARYSGGQTRKLVDVFDRLANFRLIDYQRTDNGHCGPGSDPYGCLGESKVFGLGYRIQSVPNNPSNFYPIQ